MGGSSDTLTDTINPRLDNETVPSALKGGNMPRYIINEGLDTEEVIVAASAAEGNIQWWFYDAGRRAQETRLKEQVQTIREVTQL